VIPRDWSVTTTGGGRLVGGQVVVFSAPSLASGSTTTYTVTLKGGTRKGYAVTGATTLSAVTDPNPRNNIILARTQVK